MISGYKKGEEKPGKEGCRMTDQIEKITDKIHEEYRGLSRSEIEKIVRQTIEEIQRKERKELADTVRGTD